MVYFAQIIRIVNAYSAYHRDQILRFELVHKTGETLALYGGIKQLFTGYGRDVILGPVTYLGDLSVMTLQGQETLMCVCTEHSSCT